MTVTPGNPLSTLDSIQKKVRNITGRPDNSQLSPDDINQYIQTFYVYDMPQHLRLWNLQETYTFTTQANIDKYEFDKNKYISLSPPIYIDGLEGSWLQSRDQFYRIWSTSMSSFNPGRGNGTAGPYSFIIPQSPIIRAYLRDSGTYDSDIVVCATDTGGNAQTLIDDGSGNLIDSEFAFDPNHTQSSASGSVNYLTGAFTFTFAAAISSDSDITISTLPYVAGRPRSALFFNDIITLRNVPDNCYKVSMNAYINPIPMLANNTNPRLNSWWQYIALGSSLKIFEDQAELEEYNRYYPMFQKYEDQLNSRTIVQRTNQRTPTIYQEDMNQYIYGGFFTGGSW